MIEVGRWEHSAFGNTKVLGNVGVSRLENDVWVAYRVLCIFVDVRVEGGEVVIIDLFVSLGLVIQLDGVGSPIAEGVTRIERVTNFRLVSFLLRPLTLPHFNHAIASTSQVVEFLLRTVVHIAHTSVF